MKKIPGESIQWSNHRLIQDPLAVIERNVAPILIFTYGNPSRGDDALGPRIFDLLEARKQQTDKLDRVDLLTDYQLQIEHAVDLEQREAVLFIDASVSCLEPCEFHRLQPGRDDSYTSHSMSPAAILAVYQKINQQLPPPSYLLTLRGYEFALGQPLSAQAHRNLNQGFSLVNKLLEGSDWDDVNQVAVANEMLV